MDPDADPNVPLPDDHGGNVGAPPPPAGGRPAPGSAEASIHSLRGTRDSVQYNPPSLRFPSPNNIMLRISPASGSATFGYVYVADSEIRHRDAIIAYFDSAGREVVILPCPDFESFIADNGLLYRDVMFISDLPRYVIPAGRRILEANDFNASPRHDWLPEPPDLSSLQTSSGQASSTTRRSRSSSSHQSRTLISRQDSLARSHRPDPEGFDSIPSHHYRVPLQHINMGGRSIIGGSHAGMSPLTFRGSNSVMGGASLGGASAMGGGPRVILPSVDILSISTTASPAPPFIPFAQPDLGSSVSVLDDSSSDPTPPATVPPPPVDPTPPIVSIKDKASDLGIKDVTDRDSWIEAKKIIDARLRRHPYCPGPDSKALLTTTENATASAWWEEVINFYIKPPISDLFVEESQFDGKGFEMIEHIDKYFNPSGTVDSLSHIFDLIDIKQASDENVISLKARFSRVFARLKMGGVVIDSALQVGFMLRALLSTYHGVVQDFRLGRHSLSTATLQSVVDQCAAYDKDPWKGPVGKEGKQHRNPSASVAGSTNDRSNPYDALTKCSFGSHISKWRNACKDTSDFCMICHNTSNKGGHHSKDCPILKQIGLKLVKRPPADGNDPASRVGESPAPAPSPVPNPPAPAPASDGGSTTTPGAFTAATEQESYDSGEEFDYEGKYEGSVYSNVNSKPNVSDYPQASHATAEPISPAPHSSCRRSTSLTNTQGVSTVRLPKLVLALLDNPPAHSTAFPPARHGTSEPSLIVADTGATDHMLPEKSAFISYRPVTGRRVRMGNNSFAPIVGCGSAVIAINGRRILIRECLHVPALRNPLYSLRAHQRQYGCGFIGMQGLGMFVFFPSFIVEVNTTTDCHLSYSAVGRACTMSALDYVQPIQSHGAAATASVPSPTPVLVEDDVVEDDVEGSDPPDDDSDITPDLLPTYASHWPKKPPPTPSPTAQNPVSAHHPNRSSLPLECMSDEDIVAALHHPNTRLPPVRPCDTPNSSETKSTYTPEELHRLTGCRRFRNYQHIISGTKDGTLLNTGEFPLSLGTYATIPKAPRGKAVNRLLSKYLDIVHVDIAFGDCVSVGGYKFALILVDRATRYNWTFGLKSLQHNDIQAAFLAFRDEAGSLARQFRCDCDEKLFGSAVRSFLHTNHSSIAASPAGRQSSNGLVESHWKIMVHMSRAYLTEKQMPRTFWYYAIKHSARMMNMIPGKYGSKLASPFMLAHGTRPDPRTWLPLFSICYFHHEKDSDASRSKSQAHTMDGIVIGRSPTSNAILVYNPRNQRYYEPDSYKLDPYRVPSSVYPTIKYDGGLFVSLHRDDNPAISEPYPPGTRVLDVHAPSGQSLAGTVMDIPFDPTTSPQYLIIFDDGTSRAVPSDVMPTLIPKPVTVSSDSNHLLPPFLQPGSKITYEYEGQLHKGFLGQSADGVYRFSFKSHINKKFEDWGVPLPDLLSTWQDLCVEGVLIPGHQSSSFISPRRSLAASHVSATNLKRECPRSLLTALHPTHPDRDTWMASFREEKSGIESQGTYVKIGLPEYRALRAKGAPKAIPTMCVLSIKKDEMLNPLRAKSRIVALGNHEDRVWTKSEKYAPVLRPDSLRLMVSLAVERHRTLKQGDCKNAFCQGILPDDEMTIVKPPIGDPDAVKDEYWLLKKTLYGLRRSPRHWYNKITAVLSSIGLKPNASDPCMFTGTLCDPDNPAADLPSDPLTIGLYVDDFVYFSENPAAERHFERLLSRLVTVDFMGTVDWFLGTHFQWSCFGGEVSVHLSQTGFAAHLVEDNNAHERNVTPDATPYRSGLPIDACPESNEADDCPALIERKKRYQSVVGSIGWLAQSTRPDLAPTHSFLSSYNNRPSKSHWNAALYALHYIHSTIDYGFTFTSTAQVPLHTFMSFPPSSDTEAYSDAIPPSPTQHHRLSTYSDACWGSQIGNAIRDGIQLPLFKFRSMSGAIVMRSGGPIAWKAERQERTALSSCDAEIRATNMGSRLTVNIRHMISSLSDLGYPISDCKSSTPLFNDNDACVKWCHNMTTKGNRHIENKENSTREWVADGTISISHVSGKSNVSDIFTKEMRDGANFRRLRDSFMCRSSDYIKGILPGVPTPSDPPLSLPVLAQSTTTIPASAPGMLDVLVAYPGLRLSSALSCISYAGRQILSKLAPPSYLQALMRDPMGGVLT